MKNLTEKTSLAKSIAISTDELERVITEIFGEHIIFEFNLGGMFVGTENADGETEEIPQDSIFTNLAEYFGVKSVYAVFFDDVDTNLAYINYTEAEPQNINKYALRKCIVLSLDEFTALIKELLGTQFTVDCDYEGADVVVDPELDEIYSDPEHDDVLKALSNHFGVRVTSYHADDCDYTAIWICYR
jgi:hypothetical protein